MGKDVARDSDAEYFKQKVKECKKLIDEDIALFSQRVQKSASEHFGPYSRLAIDYYLDLLGRGGKRIRGGLVMVGYEMSGGNDAATALQAARIVEMIHAYILIIDDINDRSPSRRGGDTAHVAAAKHHAKQGWAGDSAHFGESIAMNAALIGNHAAQMELANLPVDPELRLKAISVLNHGMITTVHGQFNDMFNEVTNKATEADIQKVLEWKTAYYTFLNPLTFGMVLAGAECAATDAIREYSLNAGQAFQITDDILGTFGDEFESGKSPMDDIREGKRTFLTVHALEHANRSDRQFLLAQLGNDKLTTVDFERCKRIIEQTGSLKYAKDRANTHIKRAIKALNKERGRWSVEGVAFLTGLATYLAMRRS